MVILKSIEFSCKQLPKVIAIGGMFLSFASCIDPVTPEFEYKEGLIFVEGFASSVSGDSFLTINVSAIEYGVYVVNFISGAAVYIENIQTKEKVTFNEFDGVYVPSPDFSVTPGEQWKLKIELPNGKRYESSIEQVLDPVPIVNLQTRYDPELEFQEIFGGKYLPGHELMVSFDDPPNEDNFYYWTYKSYENLDICEKCYAGYFRNGECISFPPSVSGIPYYDYLCESDCWRIRFPESIAIYDDNFTDGKSITDLSIGNLLLYTKENMVIEVQQIALTPAAHKYYKVLKDIVDNNSGINAPPPAALVGNMYNPDDSEDFIFGRFTAAATSTAAIYIERETITEDQIERTDELRFEDFGAPVPPPVTTTTPCSEKRYRTAIPPPGWVQ